MFPHLKQCAAIGVVFLATAPSTVTATDLKPEEVLQRHLESIGTQEARAAKSRVMEGTAAYRILVGGSGKIEGKAVMVSEGDKLHLLLKINALKYHGEKFVRDGDKTFVAGTYDDGSRSEFGQFLRSEDFALKEGLLGGVLSTGWPLLDLGSRKAKLRYEGLRAASSMLFPINRREPRTWMLLSTSIQEHSAML